MWKKLGGLLCGVLVASQPVCAQPNVMLPNDECGGSNGFGATPISGEGTWSAYLQGATPSVIGGPGCWAGALNDVWFCWTPAFSGTANFTVRLVQANGNPGECIPFAVYDGCTCPTPASQPAICNPGSCTGSLPEVVCGHQYLIRIGNAYPNLQQSAILSIQGAPGASAPCEAPEDGSCPDCCGAAPNYTDASFQPFQHGHVAIETSADYAEPTAADDYVVRIFNLDDVPCPPITPTTWSPHAGPPFRWPFAPVVTNEWTRAKLGTLFGMTLDDGGNIYVSHFSGHFSLSELGSLGGDTSTTIYKLASGTLKGTPSVWANLPGGSGGAAGINEPGLGNLDYSCQHETIYVSHFADGRIYRVRSVAGLGVVAGAYDHATDSISNNASLESGTNYANFAPLGERVWAVRSHNGRLYYSVWAQYSQAVYPSPGTPTGTGPNTIWSISLNSQGDFIPGTRKLELQLPANQQNFGGLPLYSMPVSDIEFDKKCRMLVSERSMDRDNRTSAHRSRMLAFASSGSGWVPTPSSLGFDLGGVSSYGRSNAAGGCAVDDAVASITCALIGDKYWTSVDQAAAGSGYANYGLCGVPQPGASSTTNVFIDYNNVFAASADKTKYGDVEIPCIRTTCANLEGRIVCQAVNEDGWTGNYVYTFTITNNSGRPVTRLLIPSGPVSPNTIVPVGPDGVGAPLQSGQTSNPITITINGPITGPTFSLPVIMYTPAAAGGEEVCCNITEELTLPDCACFQLTEGPTVACVPGMPGKFTIGFTLQPLAYDIGHVFITPPTGDVDIEEFLFWLSVIDGPTPDYIPGTVLAGNTQPFQFSLTVSSNGVGSVGTTQCVEVYTHTPDLAECCMRRVCFVVPDCLGRGDPECGSIDFNNDASLFDPQDIEAFLSVYAEGPCVPPNATCNSIDFNSDGSLFDPCDISSFLVMYSEGPCTPCGQ